MNNFSWKKLKLEFCVWNEQKNVLKFVKKKNHRHQTRPNGVVIQPWTFYLSMLGLNPNLVFLILRSLTLLWIKRWVLTNTPQFHLVWQFMPSMAFRPTPEPPRVGPFVKNFSRVKPYLPIPFPWLLGPSRGAAIRACLVWKVGGSPGSPAAFQVRGRRRQACFPWCSNLPGRGIPPLPLCW